MPTIGTVAERAGVGVETVRFYERKGLIRRPDRRGGGFRDYPPETVARIRFIRNAKALGFTLREIAELLALRPDGATSCERVRAKAVEKIEDIERRIVELRRMREALRRLALACADAAPTSECPILDALAGPETEGDEP